MTPRLSKLKKNFDVDRKLHNGRESPSTFCMKESMEKSKSNVLEKAKKQQANNELKRIAFTKQANNELKRIAFTKQANTVVQKPAQTKTLGTKNTPAPMKIQLDRILERMPSTSKKNEERRNKIDSNLEQIQELLENIDPTYDPSLVYFNVLWLGVNVKFI